MPNPYDQMFDHCLDYKYGWPDEHVVNFVAKMDPDVVKYPVYGGSIVHLTPAGLFAPGASGRQMGMVLMQGNHELDVANPGGNHWNSIAPAGWNSALVPVDGFELVTTEFEQDDAVVYAPNDILHSPTEAEVGAGNEDEAGKLYKRKGWTGGGNAALTVYTNNVCGVVSRAQAANHHGVQVLHFWPVYLPGTGS